MSSMALFSIKEPRTPGSPVLHDVEAGAHSGKECFMGRSTQFSNPVSQAKQSASEAADKAKQAGAAVSEETRNLSQSAQETAGDLAHKTQEGLGYLHDTASDYIEQGRKGMERFGQTVQEQVQQRTVPTLLLAAGIGVLFGAAALLWLRR
jgi:hypothetical protein